MIFPIYAYGHPVLRTKAKDISADYENLSAFLEDMFETMYHSHGVGLAAPQIGKSIRVFIVDTTQIKEDSEKNHSEATAIKKIFINAYKIEESGKSWAYEEGCLSIPGVRGDVMRPATIRLRYVDENFQTQEETFSGFNARVIQHEYDHLEGILFTDKVSALKRRLIQRRLDGITIGRVDCDYKMKFAPASRR